MRILLIAVASLWGSLNVQGQQDTLLSFPSARNIRPYVHGSAAPSATGFDYRYDVGNAEGAEQAIEFYFVVIGNATLEAESHPENWDQATWVRESIRALDWGSILPSANIQPGQSVLRFTLSSSFLPGIVTSRAGGAIGPDTSEEEVEYDMTNADIMHNSVEVVTVGPKYSKADLSVLSLLDTLNTLLTQAHTLTWIPVQSTADKYAGLFLRIRTDIMQTTMNSARIRIDTVLQQADLDSTSNITPEAYALMRYNTEYLRDKLRPSPDIRGGIFNSSKFDSLMVIAKPDTSFGTGDTLMGITATVRWPSQFNVTIGPVTSSYGFAKLDTPVTVGNYRYQKFHSTTRPPISWQAGQEYNLFSVPVSGTCGAETFELTNALSGGEWFVDINYLDKTDTTFYQGSVHGFAFQNKSSETWATIPNDQRHLIKGAGKLHETYSSGGEILYRRSSNGGSAWDVTTRLSRGTASCYDATIAAGASNMLYSVWERNNGSTVGLWYSRSTDNGANWSLADTLPGCSSLTPSSDQGGALRPVVAELSATPANHVIVVYANNGGLHYLKSTSAGATWGSGPTYIAPTLRTSTDNPKIWYPSLAPASSYLSLTYDYRALDPELYSRTYTTSGGWSTEACVSSGTGTIFDRCSSVAILDDNTPLVAWCAQKMVGGTLDADYRVMFRTGSSSNTWNTFTEFAKTSGISDLYPTSSTLSAPYQAARGFRVIYQRTNGEVFSLAKPLTGSWSRARLSTSGAYVSATLEKGTNTGPTFLWTDQSASPYLLAVTTSLGTPMAPLRNQANQQQATGTVASDGAGRELFAHRKVVVEDSQNHSILSYELSPILLVNTQGDTVALPFKSTDSLAALSLNTVWDYLGTEAVDIAKDARSLILDVAVQSEASADTAAGGAGSLRLNENSFRSASRAYGLEASGAAGGKQTALATDLGDGSGKAGTVNRTVIPVPAGLRGTRAAFRLVRAFVPPADLVERLTWSVGDVIYAK
jgi:hypothetical protein